MNPSRKELKKSTYKRGYVEGDLRNVEQKLRDFLRYPNALTPEQRDRLRFIKDIAGTSADLEDDLRDPDTTPKKPREGVTGLLFSVLVFLVILGGVSFMTYNRYIVGSSAEIRQAVALEQIAEGLKCR